MQDETLPMVEVVGCFVVYVGEFWWNCALTTRMHSHPTMVWLLI